MLGPRFGNIPIQNNEHANRPIHARNQPQFAVEARGGARFDENARNNEQLTSPALSRGAPTHTLDMKGGSAYVGGHSRETESQMAYDAAAGHTKPKESRSDLAAKQDLESASNTIKTLEAEGKIQRPKQPEQNNGQQQEQHGQAQQREQAQAQPARQVTQEQGEKKEKKANTHDTPRNLARQDMFAARLRGRIDAFDDAGLVKVEARKGFDSVENFNTAKGAFYATKDAISSRKFAAMAENAAPSAGNQPQQGQPEQSTEMSSPKGRFATMADRAIEGTKPTTEAGTVIKKDTGLEQG